MSPSLKSLKCLGPLGYEVPTVDLCLCNQFLRLLDVRYRLAGFEVRSLEPKLTLLLTVLESQWQKNGL